MCLHISDVDGSGPLACHRLLQRRRLGLVHPVTDEQMNWESPLPVDMVALLATLEGPLEVRHPDYVVVGSQGEVYANAADWVREHLTFDPVGGA